MRARHARKTCLIHFLDTKNKAFSFENHMPLHMVFKQLFSFIFSLFQIFPSSELSKSCRNLIDFNQIWIRNQSDFVSKSDPNLAQIMQIDVHISAHILGRSRWCFRFYAGRHVKEFSTRFEQDFEQKSDSFRFQIWSKSDKKHQFFEQKSDLQHSKFPENQDLTGGGRFLQDFAQISFRFLFEIFQISAPNLIQICATFLRHHHLKT